MQKVAITETFGGITVVSVVHLSDDAIKVMAAYAKYRRLRRLEDERQWFDHPANNDLRKAGIAESDEVAENEYISCSLTERGQKVLAKLKKAGL